MVRLKPFFIIDYCDIATAIHKRYFPHTPVKDIKDRICKIFDVTYDVNCTQIIYTSYDQILRFYGNNSIAKHIVDVLQNDNVNVLSIIDQFCISF